jgi:predicted PurR-regulated permease PerM
MIPAGTYLITQTPNGPIFQPVINSNGATLTPLPDTPSQPGQEAASSVPTTTTSAGQQMQPNSNTTSSTAQTVGKSALAILFVFLHCWVCTAASV